MYKYEIIAKEICEYLDACKRRGMNSVTISARDIEHGFSVSARCGAKAGSRYPLICQAMHRVPHYRGIAHEGPDPSSTFTMTFDLRKRRLFP